MNMKGGGAIDEKSVNNKHTRTHTHTQRCCFNLDINGYCLRLAIDKIQLTIASDVRKLVQLVETSWSFEF